MKHLALSTVLVAAIAFLMLVPVGSMAVTPPATHFTDANYVPGTYAPQNYMGGQVAESYNFSWATLGPLAYQTEYTSGCTQHACYQTSTFPAHAANASGNNFFMQPDALAIPTVLQDNLQGGSSGTNAYNFTSCGTNGVYSGLKLGATNCRNWASPDAWGNFTEHAVNSKDMRYSTGTSALTNAAEIVLSFNGTHAGVPTEVGAQLAVKAANLPSGSSSAVFLTLQGSEYWSNAGGCTAETCFVVPFLANQNYTGSGNTFPIDGTSGFGYGAYAPVFNVSTGNLQSFASATNGSYSTATLNAVSFAGNTVGTGDFYMTQALSAMSSKHACFNQTAGSCGSGIDALSTLHIGFLAYIAEANANVTVNLTGFGLTGYAVQPGPTEWNGASEYRDLIWANSSATTRTQVGGGAAGSGNPTAPAHTGVTANQGESTPSISTTSLEALEADSNYQWNLSTINPTWGTFGWANGTSTASSYEMELEQSAADLPSGNTTITLPSSTNTLTANEATINTTFGMPSLPSTQGFVTYSNWVVYDHLPVAGTQYNNVVVGVPSGKTLTKWADAGANYHSINAGQYIALASTGSVYTNGIADATVVNPTDPWMSETVSYTSTQFCTLTIDVCVPPASSNNTTSTSSAPSLIGEITTDITTYWMLELVVAAIIVAAIVLKDKRRR